MMRYHYTPVRMAKIKYWQYQGWQNAEHDMQMTPIIMAEMKNKLKSSLDESVKEERAKVALKFSIQN